MRLAVVFVSLFLFFCFTTQNIMPDGPDAGKKFPAQAEIMVPVYFDSEGKTKFINISDGQRLLSDNPLEIMERIGLLKKSDGYNIVFLGDSVVYGDGTMDERRTIPALLKKKLS